MDFLRCAAALLTGMFVAAVALFGQSIPSRNSAETQFQRAVSQFHSGQYREAEENLQSLARSMPPSFEVQELLGMVYAAEKKGADASRAFQEAVRLNPGSAAARTNLAVSLGRIGKAQQAEAEFRRAVQLAPNDFETNRDFGELYAHDGKIQEAIPYLAKAQQLRPNSYGNGYDLALAYDKAGRLKEARQEITQLLELKKTAELYDLLGEVDEQSGDYIASANDYQTAAHLDPSVQYIFDWGSEFLLHHTWTPAIEVFSTGLKRYPNSAPLAIGLGLALYWHGDYKGAVKALMRATDLAPADPHPYFFLNRAYPRAPGEINEVTARFARFERLCPLDSNAAYYYAMSLWKQKETALSDPNLSEPESLLKKAVRLDPSYAEARAALGNLYSRQRDYSNAVEEYQRALEINPKITDVYYRLGEAYVHLGKKQLAEKEFAAHQRLYNQHLAQSDRLREAIRQFVYSTRSGHVPSQTPN